MISISNTFIDNFFSTMNSQSSGLDNLSSKALENGIDLYSKGKYAEAAKEFRRSIGLSPYSDNSLETFDYLATAYLKQGKTEDAIKTYKLSISLFPSDDSSHQKLGTIYYKNGQYQEALAEYKTAVRINPYSSTDNYALGQTYLKIGYYSEAENQFKKVTQIIPGDPNAYDALGQGYRLQGKYNEAISQFQKALSLKKDFEDSVLNLGYTYADMGEIDKALQQTDLLKENKSSLGFALQNYINQVTMPKLTSASTFGGFTPTSGRKTLVSSMDSSLSNPYASKQFTMRFTFSKEMDIYSVQNPYNWQINKATGEHVGGEYNWGLPIPKTEVNIASIPIRVIYNESTRSADVTFSLSQNSTANSTIDPGHIVFKFSGLDTYGKTMDSSADEYSGFSKIV
jgi:tetratricopeptide (TPR) repeat protein